MKIIPFILRKLTIRQAAIETPFAQTNWAEVDRKCRKPVDHGEIRSADGIRIELEFRESDRRLRKIVEEAIEEEAIKNLTPKINKKDLARDSKPRKKRASK